MTTSAEWFRRAQDVLPGGVNSPVRACKSVGCDPVFIDRAKGGRLWTADGRELIDFVLSWGPMILGHCDPDVTRAAHEAVDRGSSYGAPCGLEVELAETVRRLMPNLEMLRMVSSGTEATMSALRLARGFTKRDKVVKFEGCYHGHSDSFLAKAGSGLLTFAIPGTPGVPESTVAHTLLAAYNDLAAVEKLFAAHGQEIACVIVEPVAGNMGLVLPEPGFLEGLRELCTKHGALLIFDEVITGFRVARGGAQERYGVMPDLTTLGKIIGGGFPVGAFGGRREIMEHLAPVGPVYQAGTLSGNPIAMVAGLALMAELAKPGVYDELERKGARLEAGLRAAVESAGVDAFLTRVGAMACMFFTAEEVRDWPTASTSDTDRYARYFRGMLERGIVLAPSQFEATFVGMAHTDADIDAMTSAAAEVLKGL